jgi:hypothetical protein
MGTASAHDLASRTQRRRSSSQLVACLLAILKSVKMKYRALKQIFALVLYMHKSTKNSLVVACRMQLLSRSRHFMHELDLEWFRDGRRHTKMPIMNCDYRMFR